MLQLLSKAERIAHDVFARPIASGQQWMFQDLELIPVSDRPRQKGQPDSPTAPVAPRLIQQYSNTAVSSQYTSITPTIAQMAKRTSKWPWSRRQNIWDPPTPLDKFLDSPLRAVISFIYAILLSLRGAPFRPPRNKPTVKVICISDTHNNTLNIPNGDVLIHAGDLTSAGTVQEIQAQLDWLASLPHREKIVISGNHDSYFDPKSRKAEDKAKKLDFKGIHYLENKAVTLKFKGGRKLNFYGSPDIPQCGGSDFA